MNQLQQGDVWIEKMELPEDAKAKEFDGVLALGEATGHKHRLEDMEGVEMFETSGGRTFIRLSKEKTLVHEEHKPITIPAGTFEWGQIQEYDHFLEEAKAVQD